MTGSLAIDGLGFGNMYGYSPFGQSVFDDGTGAGSIFGGGTFGVPYGGLGGMYGGYPMMGGLGMMGMMGGLMPADYARLSRMSPSARQQYVADIEDQQYEFSNRRSELMEDRQVERMLKRAQRNNCINESERAAKIAAQRLFITIQQNRKDEVLDAFSDLKAQIAKMPQNQKLRRGADGKYVSVELDDKELTSKAMEYYAQINGVNLNQHIDNELAHSFWQGMKRNFSFGMADEMDADMLNEKILGVRRDPHNRFCRGAGNVVATPLTAAAILGGTAVTTAAIGGLCHAPIKEPLKDFFKKSFGLIKFAKK